VSVPTKLSELNNDSGYITLNEVPKVNVPTKLSQLANDSGYITEQYYLDSIKSYYTKTEINTIVGDINSIITNINTTIGGDAV
jgi:hypothetical protein